MAKSLEKIIHNLKLRADGKPGILTIKLGSKKFSLPFEPRILQSDDYAFIHLVPSAAVFRVTEEGLVEIDSVEEASAASAKFRKPRSGRPRKNSEVEVPEELKALIEKIPAGHRLVQEADGNVRLVKTRRRRRS
ncbi:MAG: hypothetical protein MH204_03230 [Fimbriimonadaceae bacterium]|nr:hypothetical protein [Fimbriimonadaceae bacterium]